MQDFKDLYWHDAGLQRIVIDRSDPSRKDEIKLLVCWPDTEETDWVIFSKCYTFEAKMRFGVVEEESIFSAFCLTDTPRLSVIREKGETQQGVDLSNLKCYQIETSMGSEINIYALRFELIRQ